MKQFNECLQSKLLHTHHEGLGFHGIETGATSNLDEWHNQKNENEICSSYNRYSFIIIIK
jgi:hypothetical protein